MGFWIGLDWVGDWPRGFGARAWQYIWYVVKIYYSGQNCCRGINWPLYSPVWIQKIEILQNSQMLWFPGSAMAWESLLITVCHQVQCPHKQPSEGRRDGSDPDRQMHFYQKSFITWWSRQEIPKSWKYSNFFRLLTEKSELHFDIYLPKTYCVEQKILNFTPRQLSWTDS